MQKIGQVKDRSEALQSEMWSGDLSVCEINPIPISVKSNTGFPVLRARIHFCRLLCRSD
jgi:hypothetical protein